MYPFIHATNMLIAV